MKQDEEWADVAAAAMRLRVATGRPPLYCLKVLRPLAPPLRRSYVLAFEASRSSLLRDPIEFDPITTPLVVSIEAEGRDRLDRGEFGQGRGKAHRLWAWMKSELQSRHGIEWKSPREMNPDVRID